MQSSHHLPDGTGTDESGTVLIALLAAVLPLVLLVGASTSTMTSRNKALLYDMRQTKAMLAAESGVDEALYRMANGVLNDGDEFSISVTNDQTCDVKVTHLASDGIDNDGDADVDEADEDVFQLTITGTYLDSKRRIVAYLGGLPGSLPIEAACTFLETPSSNEIEPDDGTWHPLVTGMDTNMDGSPGGSDVEGMAIMNPPDTVSDMLSAFNAYAESRIFGASPEPSIAETSQTYDLAALELETQNTANIVLSSSSYNGFNWGDGQSSDLNIVYRDGNLTLNNGQGAGILFVTGRLVATSFRWDGLIIVAGDRFEFAAEDAETCEVYGAVIFSGSGHFQLEGDGLIYYSSEALGLVSSLLSGGSGEYLTINGWQEISIYDPD